MLYRSAKLAASAVLIFGVAACTAPADRPGAQAGVATDEFSKNIDVVGLLQVHNPFIGIKDFYRLVTHIDKQTHAFAHAIELQVAYDGNFFNFEYAADDTAQTLRLIRVKRERNTSIGDRVENFDIIVPDASLRAHATTGYRVKISARDGTYYIIEISPAMIAAQYEGMTKILGPTVGLRLGVPPGGLAATAGPVAAKAAPPAVTADGKPFLGVAPVDGSFGLGVVLQRVDKNSPAEAAGLKEGDSVLSYNGQPITGAQQFRDLILRTTPGSIVPIEVRRGFDKIALSAQM